MAVALWLVYLWIAFRVYGNRRPRRWVYYATFLLPVGISLMFDPELAIVVGALGVCVWWGLRPLERFLFVKDSPAQRLAPP